MPKNKINLNNAIIYKIVCKDLNIKDCYVGSTCSFVHRKYQHKSFCKTNKERYLYNFINNYGGWENWEMIEVAKVCPQDLNELHKIERQYLEKLGATLNKNIPTRSKKEWADDNPDKIKKKNKNYYDKNCKTIYCFCGGSYKKKNLNRHIETYKHKNFCMEINVFQNELLKDLKTQIWKNKKKIYI